MTTISNLPACPNPLVDDQDTYNTKSYEWALALNELPGQINTVAGEMQANADQVALDKQATQDAAADAAASAQAASAAAGAAVWVSGTTYAAGIVVWSPLNYLVYRRKTAGAGTTDPSADSTNWALLGLDPATLLPFASNTVLAQTQASILSF